MNFKKKYNNIFIAIFISACIGAIFGLVYSNYFKNHPVSTVLYAENSTKLDPLLPNLNQEGWQGYLHFLVQNSRIQISNKKKLDQGEVNYLSNFINIDWIKRHISPSFISIQNSEYISSIKILSNGKSLSYNKKNLKFSVDYIRSTLLIYYLNNYINNYIIELKNELKKSNLSAIEYKILVNYIDTVNTKNKKIHPISSIESKYEIDAITFRMAKVKAIILSQPAISDEINRMEFAKQYFQKALNENNNYNKLELSLRSFFDEQGYYHYNYSELLFLIDFFNKNFQDNNYYELDSQNSLFIIFIGACTGVLFMLLYLSFFNRTFKKLIVNSALLKPGVRPYF